MSIAKIIKQSSYIAPGKLKITEYFFEVPKDHSKPEDDQLRVFARGVRKADWFLLPHLTPETDKPDSDKPWCGPGCGCSRPQRLGWVEKVLDKGYQVLLMDQRGTGLSSTVTANTLAKQGGPTEQVEYLKHFRADSIVKDCEAIRKALTKNFADDKKKWSVMGQSFGGFCAVNYLSRHPEGLREVFTTGGLAPQVKQPDALYEKLYKRVADRSYKYYEKFPEDIQRIKNLAGYLTKEKIRAPSGNDLTVMRLRQLGQMLGFTDGIDTIHDLVLRMTNDLEMFGSLTRPTIAQFDGALDFNSIIIYAILHEACYLSGAASNWSADRTIKKFPEFEAASADSKDPILFTAEMIMKQMFTDFDELRPLAETADMLAQKSDWPDLYDEAQLAKNEVPVYAATYLDDLYVDFDYAQETARMIKGCKVFVTNTMFHSALNHQTDALFRELWKLKEDTLD